MVNSIGLKLIPEQNRTPNRENIHLPLKRSDDYFESSPKLTKENSPSVGYKFFEEKSVNFFNSIPKEYRKWNTFKFESIDVFNNVLKGKIKVKGKFIPVQLTRNNNYELQININGKMKTCHPLIGLMIEYKIRPQKFGQNFIYTSDLQKAHIENLSLVEEYPERAEAAHWLRTSEYPTLVAWLKKESKENKNIEVFSIGQTFHGKDIWAVEVNANAKNKILVTSALHAREWTTPYATLSLIDLFKESENKKIGGVFIPVVNPDGFIYSKSRPGLKRAMQRKNLEPNFEKEGHNYIQVNSGTDLNRNFNDDHTHHPLNLANGSSNPNHETFKGLKPGRTYEVAALENLIECSHNGKINLFVDIHSYGKIIHGEGIDPSELENLKSQMSTHFNAFKVIHPDAFYPVLKNNQDEKGKDKKPPKPGETKDAASEKTIGTSTGYFYNKQEIPSIGLEIGETFHPKNSKQFFKDIAPMEGLFEWIKKNVKLENKQ